MYRPWTHNKSSPITPDDKAEGAILAPPWMADKSSIVTSDGEGESRIPLKCFISSASSDGSEEAGSDAPNSRSCTSQNSMDWEENYYTGSRASSPLAVATESHLLACEMHEVSSGVACGFPLIWELGYQLTTGNMAEETQHLKDVANFIAALHNLGTSGL